MALFKPLLGTRNNLPTTKTDGYAYFCTDDGTFWIDYKDDQGVVQRKQINAKDAETLTGASLATTLDSSNTEIPTSKAVFDFLGNALFLEEVSVDISLPEVGSWISVTYGNDKFVALNCSTNMAAYSYDGATWIATTLPTSTSWRDVTYNNGKFVAISDNSIAAYSEDGINWTQMTLPGSIRWMSLTHSDDKFVVIAYNSSTAAYSTDGITWNTTTMPSSTKWESVAYGNGMFVAIAYNSSIAAYSTDGITWNSTTMPSSGAWQSVAYGNGKFVAIMQGNKIAAYSSDGITWNSTNTTGFLTWNRVTYGNGKFIAIASGTNIMAYSEDGINWTKATMPSSGNWQFVTYGNGKFVAIMYTSSVSVYSTDGITWVSTRSDNYVTDINKTQVASNVKGLSTNDYTDIEKIKLAGIAEGANNYILPVATDNVLGGIKSGTSITIDDSGNVSVNDDSHNHIISNIDGLQSVLDNKAPASHASDATIHITDNERTVWNAKADAPFKPSGKSYLTFSSPSSFTLKVKDATKHWDGTLEYFAEDKTWATWDGTTDLTVVDNDGEYVLYLRGTGNTVITGTSLNYRWVLTGSSIACVGNIENLLDYVTVEAGNHPTMANYCYNGMFRGCTSLTQAPALPASTLANECYQQMFRGCTSLTQAPALPATTLAYECYQDMFYGCTSLTQAPALPATTLADGCYCSMFCSCTSLTQAPALPATTLAYYCYNSIFRDCTSLTQAPALPATTLAESCYYSMFSGCTSLTQAPALPATTLDDYCYMQMFNGCTSLKLSSTQTGEYVQEYRIPMSGDGTTATDAITNMFSSTGGTFTGTPEINTTYYLSSDNMVVHDTEITTLNGYVGSMIDAITPDDLGAASKPTTIKVTLSSSGWDSTAKTQTVTAIGVLADETAQLIQPTPALASQTAYYEAGILCTGQAADSLTFTATMVPTENLTVYVVIQDVVPPQ